MLFTGQDQQWFGAPYLFKLSGTDLPTGPHRSGKSSSCRLRSGLACLSGLGGPSFLFLVPLTGFYILKLQHIFSVFRRLH